MNDKCEVGMPIGTELSAGPPQSHAAFGSHKAEVGEAGIAFMLYTVQSTLVLILSAFQLQSYMLGVSLVQKSLLQGLISSLPNSARLVWQ
jgi:hypothetical protein